LRVLVTGASGFLGRAIVAGLLERDAVQVRCQIRQPGGMSSLHALERDPGRLEIVTSNLLARSGLPRLLADVDVVIHAAAGMRGAPADLYLNTVVATRNLLDALAGSAVRRFVLISSFAVYGTHDLPRNEVINEDSPLERHPERRDGYTLAKLHQEELVRERMAQLGRELVVLRPGVIYGPGGGAFSYRVGVSMFGWFLHLGGAAVLPLSYLDNCAEAAALAALTPAAAGATFNVHDDELPTCAEYLRRYRREVARLRTVYVPYWILMALSRAVAWYHRISKGQLPAVFTPYATRTLYRSRRYDNARLKALGWRPRVSTDEGLRRTFESLRAGFKA